MKKMSLNKTNSKFQIPRPKFQTKDFLFFFEFEIWGLRLGIYNIVAKIIKQPKQ